MDVCDAAAGRVVRVRRIRLAVLIVAALSWPGRAPIRAERFGYGPEEFASRRAKLAAALREGTLVMFGATGATPGVRFRQDNDFFYLTGTEAPNAVLVMDVQSARADLFMPQLAERQVRYEGGNWLGEPGAAGKYGFTSIRPLADLHEYLASLHGQPGPMTVWTRMSERDEVNEGRTDTALNRARRLNNPFAQAPDEDAARIASLRTQFPYYELRDVTPHLDRLRLIKTPREIEILRYNGRISAEAVTRAIQATAAGKYEYELHAEATYWLLKHGMQGDAYPAIVGSGPMGNQWHYEDNGRRMSAGELVVMDYAGSLDYLTMDITRTWPVSGRFTESQLKAYRTDLEGQKAAIAAIRPGVSRAVVRKAVEDVFRRNGFPPAYAYLGHYVGLSVHDVGDWNLPFEAGMVLTMEPIIDLPEQKLHIRIEDTVLVTPNGVEVLSAAVPKEVDELLALIKH
jgi:Xaa-Pro aminopeptidase